MKQKPTYAEMPFFVSKIGLYISLNFPNFILKTENEFYVIFMQNFQSSNKT